MNLWDKVQHSDVFRSVFRHGPPTNPKEQAELVSENFFMHIHSAKVHENVLRFRTTLGLGLISLYLLIILAFTGTLLMFYYVPATNYAYANIKDLEFAVTYGRLLRAAHRWAAHLMVAAVFLHMCRVFYTASYKKPREFNWAIGVVLFMLTLFLSFTGYLLPWDQLAFWAITVGTGIAGYAPLIGNGTRELLLGGTTVGQQALIRFYVLHVMVLPGIMVLLLGLHFWRVRKDGGLARPATDPEIDALRPSLPSTIPKGDVFPTSKTYGLMALVKKGRIASVDTGPENTVLTWPHVVIRECALFLAVVLGIWVLAMVFPAPLEEPANPISPPNPAKAPWYFLGLQELVSHSALLGGVVIPALMVGALLVLPYIDRNPKGIGVWFHRSRRLAIVVFTAIVLINVALIVVGTYFRGPNWHLFWPWDVPAGGGH